MFFQILPNLKNALTLLVAFLKVYPEIGTIVEHFIDQWDFN